MNPPGSPARAELGRLKLAEFSPHALHGADRAWPEANCYVDLWIEALAWLGHEPHAILPFCFSIDWEGDQFTFFKPPLADLRALYGIVVEELNVWWSLPAHIATQLSRGRLVTVEADSFFLPDTQGTAYRLEHVKTAIAVRAIDLEQETLGYFHNAGYYELRGEDFRGTFRLEAAPGEVQLPAYVELAKLDAQTAVAPSDLKDASRALLASHLSSSPDENPVARFAQSMSDSAAWLSTQELSAFHRYAFATLRQLGAATELGARYLAWLDPGFAEQEAAFLAIATGCKALQFKLARAANHKRAFDPGETLAAISAMWESGVTELAKKLVG